MEPADYKKTKLINHPAIVYVGDLENALLIKDAAAKKLLLKIIFHRLFNRYVRPLKNILPTNRRSGFLTMAASCLLIEAYQAFLEGMEYTAKDGAGKECFKKFFKNNQAFGQLFPFSKQFYKNIRCGVLHQAETYENWLIVREQRAPLFDPQRKKINADLFFEELTKCLLAYIRHLSKADWNDPLWKNAIFKLDKICEHCKAIPAEKPVCSYCI